MTTPNLALPYPSSSDPDDVPADLQALAEAIDALGGAWSPYPPVVENFTLGSGTLVAADKKAGKSLKLRVRIASSASSGIGFALMVHLRSGLTAAVAQDFPVALYLGSAVVQAFGSIAAGASGVGFTYGDSAATLTGSAFAGTGGQVLSFVTELEVQ